MDANRYNEYIVTKVRELEHNRPSVARSLRFRRELAAMGAPSREAAHSRWAPALTFAALCRLFSRWSNGGRSASRDGARETPAPMAPSELSRGS